MPDTKSTRARKMYEATKSKTKKYMPRIICLKDITADNNKTHNNKYIGKKRKRFEILPMGNKSNTYPLPPSKRRKSGNTNNTNNYSNNSKDILLQTLQQRFGFNSYRSTQRKAINSILNRRDVLLLMPTGGGKSLCFQIPGLILHKLCIVISPLLALMKNHCDALNKKGINTKIINSTISTSEKNIIFQTLLNGNNNNKIEILYTTPEQMSDSNRFINILNNLYTNNNIALFAIDECHCISSWGHDFRPKYRNLHSLRVNYPNVPIIALTATATNNVKKDIVKSLKLNNPNVICSDFDRPNLYFSFKYIENLQTIKPWTKASKKKKGRRKSRKINKTEITQNNQKICDDINIFLKKNKYQNKCGLIYIFSRKDAETIAFYLGKEYKFSIAAYHAGMALKKKTQIQEKWERNELSIIVCTCAFGMGIDVKNVRFVIHCTINKNLDAYYQEIGRGGRDGKFTNILCYYSANMLNKHRAILLKESICKISRYKKRGKSKVAIKQMAQNDALYIRHMGNIKHVQQFAEPNKCRREILLNYFAQKGVQNKNHGFKCCDFCDNPNAIKAIKAQYQKKRNGKENIYINEIKEPIANNYNFNTNDSINESNQNYNYNTNESMNGINYNYNTNDSMKEVNQNYNYNTNESINESEQHSDVLLEAKATANIDGLKIETREHALFQFLTVIEENCKVNDAFSVSQKKELAIFNKSRTSFIYGLNLRQELENIKTRNTNPNTNAVIDVNSNTNANMNANANGNSHTNTNANVNIDEIYELIQTLQIEREWMISMVERRNDFEGFNRWKKDLQNIYSAKVNRLYLKYKCDLNAIHSLKDINSKLNEEKELLLSLINAYNPNEGSQLIWNSDYKHFLEMLQQCDIDEKQRIDMLKQMQLNKPKDNNKSNYNGKEEEEKDDDIMILSLNNKHKNVQCLISMGFDCKIINTAWDLLKHNDKTKHIAVDDAEFIIKMLDKIHDIQA